MQTTETRLTSLEKASRDCFYLHGQTEIKLQELSDEMKDFKAEMKDFKDGVDRFKEEAEKDRRAMNKKWGDLANKMGTLVEDIVIPGFYGLIKNCFGQSPDDIQCIGPRITKRHAEKRGDRREFYGLAWTDRYVFHNETKSNVNMNDINSFIENKGIVFDYFPELRGKTLVPIFSSLYLKPEHVEALTVGRCYAMMMGEEHMEIVNLEALGPPKK